jgi:WD40 repeat protein
MSASAIPPANDRENEDGSSASSGIGIERTGRYRFGPSEKMISLCQVADDRFAVGTSSGYVVVLDRNGLPMIQYRPHKACIWDVAFASSYDFATASEDGTSSVFRYDLREQELEAASVASFQSDVFAVCYSVDRDPTSAVLSGGLSATVCILHSDRKSSSFVPATTSIQALCSIPARGHALIGGGNGVITTIDPEGSKVVETSNKHARKVPAVSACGSTLLTGSFDKTLRVWDYRAGMHCSHNLVMADVLTATALSDTHAAACSGSSLFLWDLRMLNQVLAVKNKAWTGLTRGLVLHDHTLVTASVDGNARFWKFS